MSEPKIAVTGATGQLGRLVIECLLESVRPERIAALVRKPDAARSYAERGIEVHVGDYNRPDTLDAAFKGAERLLLISSSEVGQRVNQHANVIDAARRAGISLLAYTSLLHADSSPLGLAGEHRQTEALIRDSRVPFVILRNSWYTEMFAARIPVALARGAFLGSAGEGRICSAARADYAAAAATVLTAPDDQAGRVHELAGDDFYTLTQFAAEVSRQTSKTVGYKNLAEAEFKAALLAAGLPPHVAALVADSDAGTSQGALFDEGKVLSRLIGRPTTPFAATIAATISAAKR